MCLGIPGEIVSIEQEAEQGALPRGLVSFAGVRKQICLAYVPDAHVGDYVIVHAGFALGLIDPEEAREVFTLLAEIEPDLAQELKLGPETRPDPKPKLRPESKPEQSHFGMQGGKLATEATSVAGNGAGP
jgi:hydrogenase expression/formation protein HypC